MKWRKIYDALRVGPSRIAGKGLFTPFRIAGRAKIGEFEGEVKIGRASCRERV